MSTTTGSTVDPVTTGKEGTHDSTFRGGDQPGSGDSGGVGGSCRRARPAETGSLAIDDYVTVEVTGRFCVWHTPGGPIVHERQRNDGRQRVVRP